MASTRDRILGDYRKQIVLGMARTLWVSAVASWAEENRGDDEQASSLMQQAHGGDWYDVVTFTPDGAIEAAEALTKLYESANGDIVELFMLAVEADTGRPYELDVMIGRGGAAPLPNEFGNALANMAMSTGSSWFDDHKKFKLARPLFEVNYDGEDLTWSGGRDADLENPSRAELRDTKFMMSTIEEGLDSEFKQKVASIELKPGPMGKVPTLERFKKDLAANLATGLMLDDEGEECGCEHKNPVGRFTDKGERMYQDVKREYDAKGEPRAAEIAARTVYAEAKKGVPGLLNVGPGRPPGVPNPGRFRRIR